MQSSLLNLLQIVWLYTNVYNIFVHMYEYTQSFAYRTNDSGSLRPFECESPNQCGAQVIQGARRVCEKLPHSYLAGTSVEPWVWDASSESSLARNANANAIW